MEESINKIITGFDKFKHDYYCNNHNHNVMQHLVENGQNPEIMIVACCDSRVDPAIIFNANPGDLFVVRNIGNIIPPYQHDGMHHGTSTALEFGIRILKVKHLILLGHSHCVAMNTAYSGQIAFRDDFIKNWLSILNKPLSVNSVEEYTKWSLCNSYANCMSFPWIKSASEEKKLIVHKWLFDLKSCSIDFNV